MGRRRYALLDTPPFFAADADADAATISIWCRTRRTLPPPLHTLSADTRYGEKYVIFSPLITLRLCCLAALSCR